MATRAIKVVLSTGKVVLLREMKISDTEKAAGKVSRRADGDPMMMQIFMKKALVQSLLLKIAVDEKSDLRDISGNEKEDFDSLFSMAEYGQLIKAINKMSGEEESGNEAKVEFLEV